jgi:hypothetical protein
LTQEIEFSEIAATDESLCALEADGYLRCSQDSLRLPEDPYIQTHPTWAPDAQRRAAVVEARRKLFAEFEARFAELSVPFKAEPSTRIPIGATIESRFLPLIHNVALDGELSETEKERKLRYGFRLTGLERARYLVLVGHGSLELYVFDADGVRLGRLTVAARRPYEFLYNGGCVHFLDTKSVREELIQFSVDAKGTVQVTGQRTRELTEFEPISKRWVFQCQVLTMKQTARLQGKTLVTDGGGWMEKLNRVGEKGCADEWPLGGPFWTEPSKTEATAGNAPSAPSTGPALAQMPSCVAF